MNDDNSFVFRSETATYLHRDPSAHSASPTTPGVYFDDWTTTLTRRASHLSGSISAAPSVPSGKRSKHPRRTSMPAARVLAEEDMSSRARPRSRRAGAREGGRGAEEKSELRVWSSRILEGEEIREQTGPLYSPWSEN